MPLLLKAQKRTVKSSISLEGNTFHIKNVNNGLYLDLSGRGGQAEKHNGANVQLWKLDDGNDRKVKFIPTDNGYYKIQFLHAKVNLDVHGCFDGKWFCLTYKKEKGANIQIWADGSNAQPQQWMLEQINPGQFKIVNRYSGKVLDAQGGGTKNGTNVIQWTWSGNSNQLWELIDVKTGTRYQL